MLLLSKHFEQLIKLQLIEKNKNKEPSSTESPNPTTSNVVKQAEPLKTCNLKDSTLPEKIIKANQKDNLCTNIHAYLKNLKMHVKPEDLRLKDYKMSKDLLIKEN